MLASRLGMHMRMQASGDYTLMRPCDTLSTAQKTVWMPLLQPKRACLWHAWSMCLHLRRRHVIVDMMDLYLGCHPRPKE